MTPKQKREAKALYADFQNKYPQQVNPADIDTPEKVAFLAEHGLAAINTMRNARKLKLPFTKLTPKKKAP